MGFTGGFSGGGVGPAGAAGADGAAGQPGYFRTQAQFTQPALNNTVTSVRFDTAFPIPGVGSFIAGAPGVYEVVAVAANFLDLNLVEERGVASGNPVATGTDLFAAGPILI